jgi:hypoxanthine phosphoribosyltransferase
MPENLIPVLSRAEIAAKVKNLAEQISRDYEPGNLCVIGVLKGVFVFLADLVRELDIPVEIDFVRIASYGSGTVSSENIRITKDLELDVKNRDVLIVEDIIDSGLTIAYFLEHLKQFRPKTVRVCAFIDKTERRKVEVPIDYVGHVVEKGFLVGYGLDCDEKYRQLPDVCQIET